MEINCRHIDVTNPLEVEDGATNDPNDWKCSSPLDRDLYVLGTDDPKKALKIATGVARGIQLTSDLLRPTFPVQGHEKRVRISGPPGRGAGVASDGMDVSWTTEADTERTVFRLAAHERTHELVRPYELYLREGVAHLMMYAFAVPDPSGTRPYTEDTRYSIFEDCVRHVRPNWIRQAQRDRDLTVRKVEGLERNDGYLVIDEYTVGAMLSGYLAYREYLNGNVPTLEERQKLILAMMGKLADVIERAKARRSVREQLKAYKTEFTNKFGISYVYLEKEFLVWLQSTPRAKIVELYRFHPEQPSGG